jgi:hypothetical protein
MTTLASKLFDITSFDAVAESDGGYEFELKGTDGMTGTGVLLTVIGKHSNAVNLWLNKIVNDSIRERVMAERKNKPIEPKSFEDIKAQNLQGAVLRVIGWKNVTQEFSKELLLTVLQKNPHFVEQIIEQSDNLGNFTKAV